MDELSLERAIEAIKSGNKAQGRLTLEHIVEQQPLNEVAWLWLCSCVDTDDEKRFCLNKVLKINPLNQAAILALQRLNSQAATPTVDDLVPDNFTVSQDQSKTAPPHVNSKQVFSLGKRKDVSPGGSNFHKKTFVFMIISIMVALAILAVILVLNKSSSLLFSVFGTPIPTFTVTPTLTYTPTITLTPTSTKTSTVTPRPTMTKTRTLTPTPKATATEMPLSPLAIHAKELALARGLEEYKDGCGSQTSCVALAGKYPTIIMMILNDGTIYFGVNDRLSMLRNVEPPGSKPPYQNEIEWYSNFINDIYSPYVPYMDMDYAGALDGAAMFNEFARENEYGYQIYSKLLDNHMVQIIITPPK